MAKLLFLLCSILLILGQCGAQENATSTLGVTDTTEGSGGEGPTTTAAPSLCESDPCLENEICTLDEPKEPGYACIKDPCLSDPCRNSGKCTEKDTSFVCECKGGYTGDLCEVSPPCGEIEVDVSYATVKQDSDCSSNYTANNATISVHFNGSLAGEYSSANITCNKSCDDSDTPRPIGVYQCGSDGKWMEPKWINCDATSEDRTPIEEVTIAEIDTADPEKTTASIVNSSTAALESVANQSGSIPQEEASSVIAVTSNLLLATGDGAEEAVAANSKNILESVDSVASSVVLTEGVEFDFYVETQTNSALGVAATRSTSTRAASDVYYGFDNKWDSSYNLATSTLNLSSSEPTGSYISSVLVGNRVSFKMYVTRTPFESLPSLISTKVVLSADSSSSGKTFTFKFQITDSTLTVDGTNRFNESENDGKRRFDRLQCMRWNREASQWREQSSCTTYSANGSYAFCTCDETGEYLMSKLSVIEDIETEGLSPGAIAGIVVGSVAGVALIGGVVYYFVFSSKAKAKKKSAVSPVPQKDMEMASHTNAAPDSDEN